MRISHKDAVAVLTGIGEEVKRRRCQLELTQIDLAQMADVHTNVVGRLERGGYNPTVLVLLRIATALDMPMDQLIRRAAKN
jgi:transcriptional regulator with XRE-family HTH domain